MLSEGPIVVLAAPKAPFRDFAEMVSYVRANPGKVSYASSGIAGPQHPTGEYLSSELEARDGSCSLLAAQPGASPTCSAASWSSAILGHWTDPAAHSGPAR